MPSDEAKREKNPLLTSRGFSRKRVFEIIEKGEKGDKGSLFFDWIIMFFISLSVLSVIVESFQGVGTRMREILWILEVISVSVFTFEYFLRLWTSSYMFPHSSKTGSFFRYLFSLMSLVDLLAILPFYLPFFLHLDFRFLRILRLIRILSILKISRYNASFILIKRVLSIRKYELIVTISTTFLLLLLSSSAMYYIENDAQPDKFPNIIASFWWAIATLTTVGYGDVYPLTVMGKVLSAFIALLGIGIVALPTSILSTGFIEVIRNERNKDKYSYCPYCGKKMPDQ